MAEPKDQETKQLTGEKPDVGLVTRAKESAAALKDRAHVELDAEGQIVVNIAKLYKWEKGVPAPGEFNDPGAYIPL